MPSSAAFENQMWLFFGILCCGHSWPLITANHAVLPEQIYIVIIIARTRIQVKCLR